MKRVGLLVLSALLLGAACADETGVGGAPGPDAPVTGGSPSVPPTPGGPILVRPREGLVDVRPRTWEEARPVAPQTLLVAFWSGPEECFGLDRVEVDEGEQAVTVTLFEGRDPDAEVCIEIAVRKAVRVSLDEPLGDRRVVDGAA